MKKGIKSRRMILEMAFRLFATYSYPDVSYSLLEEATGISRGSMVYYFKNKEGIFRAVLETFLFKIGNVCDLPENAKNTLAGFYDAFVKHMESSIEGLRAYRLPNLSEARFNIERSAAQFIPEFKEQEAQHQKEALNVWKEVIGNATTTGEIKPDINPEATAQLFQALYMGYVYMGAFTPNGYSLSYLRGLFDNLYSLLKP